AGGSTALPPGLQRLSLAVKDLLGDGTDAFAYADEAGARVWVERGGDRTVLGDARSGLKGPVAVHLADLNDDGALDLVVCDRAADRVFIYLGGDGGVFGPELNGREGLLAGAAPVDAAVLPAGEGHGPRLVVVGQG